MQLAPKVQIGVIHVERRRARQKFWLTRTDPRILAPQYIFSGHHQLKFIDKLWCSGCSQGPLCPQNLNTAINIVSHNCNIYHSMSLYRAFLLVKWDDVIKCDFSLKINHISHYKNYFFSVSFEFHFVVNQKRQTKWTLFKTLVMSTAFFQLENKQFELKTTYTFSFFLFLPAELFWRVLHH